MLIGKRIQLRAVEKEDYPILHEFANDLEVELAGGGDPPMPQSLEQTQREMEGRTGGTRSMAFVIEHEGHVIGSCGFFNQDQVAGTLEFGIGIGDKTHWGRGLGREAIALMLEFAFVYHNYRKVYMRVWGCNQRAIRAYTSSGFIEEARQKDQVWQAGKYHDLIFFACFRELWLQSREE